MTLSAGCPKLACLGPCVGAPGEAGQVDPVILSEASGLGTRAAGWVGGAELEPGIAVSIDGMPTLRRRRPGLCCTAWTGRGGHGGWLGWVGVPPRASTSSPRGLWHFLPPGAACPPPSAVSSHATSASSRGGGGVQGSSTSRRLGPEVGIPTAPGLMSGPPSGFGSGGVPRQGGGRSPCTKRQLPCPLVHATRVMSPAPSYSGAPVVSVDPGLGDHHGPLTI